MTPPSPADRPLSAWEWASLALLLLVVVAFGYLLSINVVLTFLALIPLAGFAFVSTKAFGKLRPAFRDRGQIRAEVTGRLNEALGGIRVIKGFHALEKEREIFHAGVMRIFDNVKTTLKTSSLVTSLGGMVLWLMQPAHPAHAAADPGA